MMATPTLAGAGRSVAVVAAGAVTAGVLAVGAFAPANAAETGASPAAGASASVAGVSEKQTVTSEKKAKKGKKGKKGRDGSLKAAKRAEKKARDRVDALVKDLDDAEGSAIGPTNQYNSAVRDEAAAKSDAAEQQKKVDRAKYLLVPANQNALFQDITNRGTPALNAENAARNAWDAAKGVVTSLQGQSASIQKDLDVAYSNSTTASNVVNDLQYNQLPAAAQAYNAAAAAVGAAATERDRLANDFEVRKAQWESCRKPLGRWECLRSGTWRYVPNLDDAEKARDDARAVYQMRLAQQADAGGVLDSVNRQLAAAQADLANIVNLINGLSGQKAAVDGQIPGAKAAVDAAYATYQDKVRATDVFRKEMENLIKEIESAKTALPNLEAAQARYNTYLADASAKVASLAPAYQAASAKVADVNDQLAKAREVLKQAVQRVKDIRKGRGR